MVVILVLLACIAGVMSTPITPTNETLRGLLNPTPGLMKNIKDLGNTLNLSPELMKNINELKNTLKPSPDLIKNMKDLGKTLNSSLSFAAAHPEMAVNFQSSNLNLVSGLTDIIRQILSGLLNRGQTSQPSQPSLPFPQPVPTNPRVMQPMPFNPFGFMFPGGGNPMSMLYPGMMFNMMDGLFEGFF